MAIRKAIIMYVTRIVPFGVSLKSANGANSANEALTALTKR
jgi:hypothetical protein